MNFQKTVSLLLILLGSLLAITSVWAKTAIKINSASYDQDVASLTLKGVNFDAYETPEVTIGGTPLLGCSVTPLTIQCPLSNTPAESGGNFTVTVSAGNSPHTNEEIDVFILNDTGASCIFGSYVECYPGDQSTWGVGVCRGGTQTCLADASWSQCEGYVTPISEVCGDLLDNDCDGVVDNGCDLPLAEVRINEVSATKTSGCDLVELRAISSGSMSGIQLLERTTSVLTFSEFNVEAGDIIVVHFNGSHETCNPNASGNEVTGKEEYPSSTYSQNYSIAWDWYTDDTGITSTTNVLTLQDGSENILDGVLLADDLTGVVAALAETQAAILAEAGQWEQVSGGVPDGGFIGEVFRQNAVLDLNATGDTESIQRINNNDTNTKADWTQNEGSFGATN